MTPVPVGRQYRIASTHEVEIAGHRTPGRWARCRGARRELKALTEHLESRRSHEQLLCAGRDHGQVGISEPTGSPSTETATHDRSPIVGRNEVTAARKSSIAGSGYHGRQSSHREHRCREGWHRRRYRRSGRRWFDRPDLCVGPAVGGEQHDRRHDEDQRQNEEWTGPAWASSRRWRAGRRVHDDRIRRNAASRTR